MRRLLLDTNLLVLCVVGRASRDLVRSHPRTQSYSVADYDLLDQMLGRFEQVYVTAGVLAESSNLLRLKARHDGPLLMQTLAGLFAGRNRMNEAGIPVQVVSCGPAFVQLGYADAVLTDLASDAMPLLTSDNRLYQTVAARSHRAAINFNHERAL